MKKAKATTTKYRNQCIMWTGEGFYRFNPKSLIWTQKSKKGIRKYFTEEEVYI